MTDTPVDRAPFEPTRRTKRRYAHELYPVPEEGEARPLDVEVRYHLSRAIGYDVSGTSWGSVEPRTLAGERIMTMLREADLALLAVALHKGLSGQEAWDFMATRATGEVSEWISEFAVEYAVDWHEIKPYQCGPEPDHHSHLSNPDPRGDRMVTFVDGKESECPDCTEEVPA
jgi:hypothetical protein